MYVLWSDCCSAAFPFHLRDRAALINNSALVLARRCQCCGRPTRVYSRQCSHSCRFTGSNPPGYSSWLGIQRFSSGLPKSDHTMGTHACQFAPGSHLWNAADKLADSRASVWHSQSRRMFCTCLFPAGGVGTVNFSGQHAMWPSNHNAACQ
jgi:hypothetical protein